MIILTDGNTDTSSKRLDLASWPLRGQKEIVGNETYSAVSILAISIGDTINTEQLKNVVSYPVDDNVFLAANYDDLYNNVRELAKESCQYKPGNHGMSELCAWWAYMKVVVSRDHQHYDVT